MDAGGWLASREQYQKLNVQGTPAGTLVARVAVDGVDPNTCMNEEYPKLSGMVDNGLMANGELPYEIPPLVHVQFPLLP